MKIALTYAPSEQQFLPVPPLGISVLSQHLKNNNIDNDIIDLELELWLRLGNKSSEYASKTVEELVPERLPVECLLDLLKGYEVVSFSLMGKRQIPYVIAIVNRLRAMDSKLKYVIVGGAFFNDINAKDIIINWKGVVDFAIVGEGWQPLQDLMNKFNSCDTDYHIPGVACLDENGQFIYCSNKKWDGELPIPNYVDINKAGYVLQQKVLYGIEDDSIIYHVLVGDRKCPYNCSFCRISDTTKKVKSPIEIADEMIELNKLSGAKCFSLVCNEMNPTESYFHEFLDRLLSYNRKLSWFAYLRPNKLNRETLKKAKKAGCVLVRYGVETGSQKILDHMNKVLYVDEMEQIMKDTYEAGIWNHINIVTGYLHESQKDIDLTLDFLERNKEYIDSVRVNPFYVPVNSPIHVNPEKYGITLRKNTGSYVQFDEPKYSWEQKQISIREATAKVLIKCMETDINFAGILPFLVAEAVDHFKDTRIAKDWIKRNHNYLCQPVSPDTAKWRLAHPERTDVMINKWEEIAGKRGSNYQTLMELNNDEEDSY